MIKTGYLVLWCSVLPTFKLGAAVKQAPLLLKCHIFHALNGIYV